MLLTSRYQQKEFGPLIGTTLQASLKMRCDTSGAGYAIYWAHESGKLVVAGDYVTDAWRTSLEKRGLAESFAQRSEAFVFDASGNTTVALVYKTGEPTFIQDFNATSMKRKELAAEYGIAQIMLIPFEQGVLEYGTTPEPSCVRSTITANWDSPPQCPNVPTADMRRGFDKFGASYCMFWAQKNGKFEVIADFVSETDKVVLKKVRSHNSTFCSESRDIQLEASSDSPVATAARLGLGWEVTSTVEEFEANSSLKRAALAKEFGIKRIHLVRVEGGVLEYGIPANAFLSGASLGASLKMHCDVSGAGYALYWREMDGEAVVAGSYITPAHYAHLAAKGLDKSFTEAGDNVVVDASGCGPVATVVKTSEPVYVQDAATCSTLKRMGLAIYSHYGTKSICFTPVPGGVIEYGTSNGPSTSNWACMADARPNIIPKAELDVAFSSGAIYAIFWKLEGDNFFAQGSYVIPEKVRALKAARGDDKSFAGQSMSVKLLASEKGPVANTARSGKKIVIEDVINDPSCKRSKLAEEFGVVNLHSVPCKDGVLEYGTSYDYIQYTRQMSKQQQETYQQKGLQVQHLKDVAKGYEKERYIGEEESELSEGTVLDLMESQVLLQRLTEDRFDSLQRFISFCVLFHSMAKKVQDFWPAVSLGLLGYDMSRSHSIMRVASTASPVSGADLRSKILETSELRATHNARRLLKMWVARKREKVMLAGNTSLHSHEA